jgi:hypothetical protein
LELGKVLGED